jgi:hypothetical protein
MFSPSNNILPDFALTTPLMVLIVVVFPAPLAPKMATIEPSSTLRLIPLMARILP